MLMYVNMFVCKFSYIQTYLMSLNGVTDFVEGDVNLTLGMDNVSVI